MCHDTSLKYCHMQRESYEDTIYGKLKNRKSYITDLEHCKTLIRVFQFFNDSRQCDSIYMRRTKKKNTEESNLTKKKKKKKEKTKNEITTQTKKKNRIFTVRSVPSPARVINHGISWIKSVTGFSLARAREREGRKEMQRLGRWFLLNRLCWTV